MKKIKFLLLLFLALMLVGCKKQTSDISDLEEEISITVPQGTPFIAVGNLMGSNNLTIEPVSGAAGVKTALIEGKSDIVIAPLNLGAQLYNKGNSKYELSAVIGFGNTYVISKKNIQLSSIQDLNGKKILAYSQGGTPDIVLQYVLNQNNVSAEIEYMGSVSEVVPFLIQGTYDYVLAAEPVITNIKENKKVELNILNLQDYIDEKIMQAGIFVNPASEKQESIDIVLNSIEKNIKNMNENVEEYAKELINKHVYFSDLTENILVKSIPNSNLGYMNALENKAEVEKYLNMINYELPKEEFYR